MRTISVTVVLGLASGCDGKSTDVCGRFNTLCNADFSADDLVECRAKLPEVFRDKWQTVVSCTAGATSCIEASACWAESIDARGEALLDKFANRGPSSSHASHDGPLPAPCARANEVCADDEPFARDQCARLAGNLKADPENTAKLVACYKEAKNCFAFTSCTDEMRMDLQRTR